MTAGTLTPASILRRLCHMKLTTSSGGNVSILTDNDTIRITPGGTDKAQLQDEMLINLPRSGTVIPRNCSMETMMHRAIYNARSDIRAVVHAHPPAVTALSCSTRRYLDTTITDETHLLLGTPNFLPPLKPGSDALAAAVAEAAKHSTVIILEHHGAVTLGKSLREAFNKMEVLEHTVSICINLSLLGHSTIE